MWSMLAKLPQRSIFKNELVYLLSFCIVKLTVKSVRIQFTVGTGVSSPVGDVVSASSNSQISEQLYIFN